MSFSSPNSLCHPTTKIMAFVQPTPQVFRAQTALRASSFLSTEHTPRHYTVPSNKRKPQSSPTYRSRSSITMQAVDVKKHEVSMPALSSTMTEGRIVQWLKEPGDKVDVGDTIMIVESDKADMDVESFDAGYLATIIVEEGDSCAVGQPVAFIVENEEDIDKVQAVATPSAPVAPSAAPSTSEKPAPEPSEPPAPANPGPSATAAKPDLIEISMPALSSTMTEGKIVEWLKSEGDVIETGDMVMVVESDKADMDVESFDSGYLAHISVDAGDSMAVGEPVAYIAKTEADVATVKAWATSKSTSSSSPSSNSTPVEEKSASVTPQPTANTPAPVTPVQENLKIVNEGRIIASPLAKATAKKEGVDLRYVKGTGPNGRIVEADVHKAKAAQAAATPAARTTTATPGKTIATPEAKKIAKKEKIDLATVKGTGNFGRITSEDVLKAAGKAPVPITAKSPAPAVKEKSAPKPAEKAKPVEVPAGAVAMNSMQKAVVHNMCSSLSVPVFRLTYKIKTRALDDLYAKVKPKGVTMSALLAKAVAITLAKHPIMNAAYAENSIVYRPEINVSMAVALEDGGLMTPTLKDADKVDLYSLSRSWKDLVKRSQSKKLTPDEYSSGTFFITNLGMFGVDQFDAILPPGVPGILAIGASKPVVGLQDNGLVGVEKQMKVTLTADHRHIYGADGAKFLKDLALLIEGDITEVLM